MRFDPEQIYPSFKIHRQKVIEKGQDDRFTFWLNSYIRKLHTDGKWYVMNLSKTHTLSSMPTKDDEQRFLCSFHLEAYKWIILGVVDLSPRQNLWHIDDDQQSEKERLMDRYGMKHKPPAELI